MQVGWPGLSRVIALTVMVTSAFWIALGAWLFRSHVAAEHAGRSAAARSSAAAGQGSEDPSSGGSGGLAGLVGGGVARQSAQPAPGARLVIPVAGVSADKLVDTFVQARASGARRHDAIDILAPEGTPVVAAAAGKVEKLFLSEDGGNTVYVRSPDRRWIFYYAHLAGYAPGLREGMNVGPGQPIGMVGHTGNANPEAPHLHLAIWRADPRLGWYQDTAPIDPYPLLSGRAAPVQPPAPVPSASPVPSAAAAAKPAPAKSAQSKTSD